ncbi:MAG: hypothetical protein IPM24_11660 [Bryobacterales bacterium]|nr:hypothetical protein [Bryobacterales bacterium]
MRRVVALLLLSAFACLAQVPTEEQQEREALDRGQRLSAAIAAITSTAVSPLLGVTVLGAWEYFRTPEEQRTSLPRYARPWFWIGLSLLLLLVLSKDTVGGAAPLLKKPLDAVEVLVMNKAALVLLAFPLVIHEAGKVFGVDGASMLFSALDPARTVFAANGLESAAYTSSTVLLAAAGLAVTVVVWLVGDAIDVLVLLCPFPFFDLLLKGMRTALFAAIAGTAYLNATAGLILSLIVIAVCAFLAGWAFRMAVFGAVFSWELLSIVLLGREAAPRPGDPIRAFTARRIAGVPKRTYGTLERPAGGALAFRYRRWPWSRERVLVIPDGERCQVGRGILHPAVVRPKEKHGSYETLLRLLPRYGGAEEAVAGALGLAGVRDIRFGHGLQAFWRWLNEGETNGAPATA